MSDIYSNFFLILLMIIAITIIIKTIDTRSEFTKISDYLENNFSTTNYISTKDGVLTLLILVNLDNEGLYEFILKYLQVRLGVTVENADNIRNADFIYIVFNGEYNYSLDKKLSMQINKVNLNTSDRVEIRKASSVKVINSKYAQEYIKANLGRVNRY